MSRFITSLRVEQIEDVSSDGRGTWQLLHPLAYKSDLAKTIFVAPVGFVTDFASVPRIPVAFFLAGSTAHRAAVIHDLLYTNHEVDRSMADTVFREACGICDVPAWRSWLMWLGVRIGGGASWDAPGPDQSDGVETLLTRR